MSEVDKISKEFELLEIELGYLIDLQISNQNPAIENAKLQVSEMTLSSVQNRLEDISSRFINLFKDLSKTSQKELSAESIVSALLSTLLNKSILKLLTRVNNDQTFNIQILNKLTNRDQSILRDLNNLIEFTNKKLETDE